MLAKDVKHGTIIEKIFKVDKPVVEGDVDDPNAPLIFTITTDVVDREGDVVDPNGVIVSNYKNNAVMQWAHKYDELPVGKSVEMWATKVKAVNKAGEPVEQNAIQAAVIFQPDENYHESYAGLRGSMVRRMYMTGFLNAVSIGFDPQEWEELEHKLDEGKGVIIQVTDGTRFTSWELLEFSAVPVPANPQALMQRSKEFGIDKKIIKLFLAEMTRYCTEEDGCPMREDKTVLRPYPNEHACRLKDPGAFEDGTFRRMSRDHEGKTYDVIMGKLKGESSMTEQAYRYPKTTWDAASAKSHCADHNGSFEAASSASKTEADMMAVEKFDALEKRIGEVEAAMKAGRVLSAKNETDLRDADKHTDQAGELIEGVLEQVTGKPVTEPTDTGSDVTGTPAAPPAAAPKPPKGFDALQDGVIVTTLDGKSFEMKGGELVELPKQEVKAELKDDDEIEVDVDTLLGVLNERPEVEKSDDDEIEVDTKDLLAVINGETEA